MTLPKEVGNKPKGIVFFYRNTGLALFLGRWFEKKMREFDRDDKLHFKKQSAFSLHLSLPI